MDQLTFIVPPGIGDFSWVYSKLASLGRPLRILVPSHQSRNRLLPFLKLLPHVSEASYGKVPNPANHRDGNVQPDWTARELIDHGSAGNAKIELNTWLESGSRIEAFMPEIPTSHHYDIQMEPEGRAQATALLDGWDNFICFYCANRDTVTRWGGWQPSHWARLADLLWEQRGLDGFVLIGAGWDEGFNRDVEDAIRQPVRNLVGRLSLSGSLHIIQTCSYLVAFPSGIPIVAAVMGRPVLMFYPRHLELMIDAWADPAMIRSGAYKGMIFPEPEQACDWLSERFDDIAKEPAT